MFAALIKLAIAYATRIILWSIDVYSYTKVYALHYGWVAFARLAYILNWLELFCGPSQKIVHAMGKFGRDEHRRIDITIIVKLYYLTTAEPTCAGLKYFIASAYPRAPADIYELKLYYSSERGTVDKISIDLDAEHNLTDDRPLKYGSIRLNEL